MRLVWSILVVVLVIALGAWGTTCTGPRPRPTGDTVPPVETTVPTSSVAP